MALSATPRRLALLRGGPSKAAGDPPGCTVRGPGRGASAARGRSGPRSSCGGNELVSSGTDGPGGQAPPHPARPFSLQWAAPPQPSAAAPGGPGPAAGRASQGHRHAERLHGQALRLCGLPHEPLNPDTKVTKKQFFVLSLRSEPPMRLIQPSLPRLSLQRDPCTHRHSPSDPSPVRPT